MNTNPDTLLTMFGLLSVMWSAMGISIGALYELRRKTLLGVLIIVSTLTAFFILGSVFLGYTEIMNTLAEFYRRFQLTLVVASIASIFFMPSSWTGKKIGEHYKKAK